VTRKVALMGWLSRSIKGALLDEPLRLSELLNPGTFLNAVRQKTARLCKCPLDHLKLISGWSKGRIDKSAKLTVTLSGMLMQGALLQNNTLVDADMNDAELVTVPNCYIGFVSGKGPHSIGAVLSAPVYYTPARERLLTEFDVPIQDSPQRWIMAGVALFLASRV